MDREDTQKSKRLRLECPVCKETYTDSVEYKSGCPHCDENVCNSCQRIHLPICKSFKLNTELEQVEEVSKVLMDEMESLVKRANDLHKNWQKDMRSGLQEVGVSLMSHPKMDRVDNISSIKSWNATHEQIITKMKKLIKAALGLRKAEFLRDTLNFKSVEETIENIKGLGGLDSVSDTSVNSSSDSSSSDSGSSDNLSPDNFWPDKMALNMPWDNIPSNNNRSSDSSSSDSSSSDNLSPNNFWPDNMAQNNIKWYNIPSKNNGWSDSSSSDRSSSDSGSSDNLSPGNFWPNNMALNNMRWDNNNGWADSSSSDSSSSDSSSSDSFPSNNIWLSQLPPDNNSSSDSSSSSSSDGGLLSQN